MGFLQDMIYKTFLRSFINAMCVTHESLVKFSNVDQIPKNKVIFFVSLFNILLSFQIPSKIKG